MQLRYFLLGESLTQGCLSCWKVDPSTDPSRCNLPLCRCSSSEEPSYVLPTPWLQYESPVFPEALLGCSSCFGLSSVACNRSRSLEASCEESLGHLSPLHLHLTCSCFHGETEALLFAYLHRSRMNLAFVSCWSVDWNSFNNDKLWIKFGLKGKKFSSKCFSKSLSYVLLWSERLELNNLQVWSLSLKHSEPDNSCWSCSTNQWSEYITELTQKAFINYRCFTVKYKWVDICLFILDHIFLLRLDGHIFSTMSNLSWINVNTHYHSSDWDKHIYGA